MYLDNLDNETYVHYQILFCSAHIFLLNIATGQFDGILRLPINKTHTMSKLLIFAIFIHRYFIQFENLLITHIAVDTI